jgi:GAF domain-containing protein
MSLRPTEPQPATAPLSTLLARQRLAYDMIDRGDALADVLALLCHIVEAEAVSSVRAAILLVDHATCRLRTGAAPGLPDSYNRAVDGIGIDPGVGTCAAAAALRKPVVTVDIGADPSWKDLAHLPLGLGLVAAWSMPIQVRDGPVLGTFGTYFTECREPTGQERDLVAILARTTAEAIERCA